MSSSNPFEDMIKDLLSEAYKGESFGRAESIPLPEEMGKLASDTLAEEYKHIHKVGMTLPVSFERFLEYEPRKGSYVPTGSRLAQKTGWLWGLLKYKLWRKLEKSLEKSRHFHGISGYEWDDATYSDFKQERVWKDAD